MKDATASDYAVSVGLLRTGRIVAELPGSPDFEDALGKAGSGKVTVPVDAVPSSVDVAAVTAPWRCFLAVSRGERVVFAGPIVTRKSDNGQLEVGASGLGAVFDHRVLARFGPWELTDPRADVILTGRSLPSIAVELVRVALDRPHGELPLVLPIVVAEGTEERRYFGHELAMVGDRLTKLSTEEHGPEIHFTPRFQPDTRHVEWVMRLGDPYLSQSGAPWVFDADTGLVAFTSDEDGSRQACTVLVPGDGTEHGRLIGHADNEDQLAHGWPPLDVVITDHTSVKDPAVLHSQARAHLDAYRSGVRTDSATIRVDTGPAPGAYRPGDHAVFLPAPDHMSTPGPRLRRITGIAGRSGTDDTVELTLAPT